MTAAAGGGRDHIAKGRPRVEGRENGIGSRLALHEVGVGAEAQQRRIVEG